jgi:hypothetical protein
MAALDNDYPSRRREASLGDTSSDETPIISNSSRETCQTGCCAEEASYKKLISAEMKKQKVSFHQLQGTTGKHRSTIARIINGETLLTEEVRIACFLRLSIDQHQAYICVALLRDIDAYHSPEADLLAENLKAMHIDICNMRQGTIRKKYKRAIIKTAAKVTVDAIIQHQDTIDRKEREFIESHA